MEGNIRWETASLSRPWLCHALRNIFQKLSDLFCSMSISISRLFYEISYTLDWRGNTWFKFQVYVGFICSKAPAELVCSRAWLVVYSLFTEKVLKHAVLACAPLYCTVNFTDVFQWCHFVCLITDLPCFTVYLLFTVTDCTYGLCFNFNCLTLNEIILSQETLYPPFNNHCYKTWI
jgi:hypothetical protein